MEAALSHLQPGVRRHALRLAEPRFGENKTLLPTVVKLHLALTLGESRDARATTALGRLAFGTVVTSGSTTPSLAHWVNGPVKRLPCC